MSKRTFSILLALALVAGVFSALPAKAQTTVPAEVNIEDPAQDANGLNDQLDGQTFGDEPTPAYFGGADFLKVWFSTVGSTFNVHMLTSSPNGGGNFAYVYRVHVNENCTWFQGNVEGATNSAANSAVIRDACDGAEPVPGEIKVEELDDGTGVTTMSFPVGSHPHVAAGAVIAGPFASSRLFTPSGHTAPQLDTTLVGTDYTVGAGGGPVAEPEEPKEEPPGKSDPPGKGKKKGCKKGKGKKKGACPGKKPGKPKPPIQSCAPYAPGEEGAEAETTIVTDAATAEKPVVVELTAGAGLTSDPIGTGLYDESSSVFQNVQVDTANVDAGLYAKLEFQEFHDYDLYLNYADGTTAANSGDFQIAPGEGIGGGSPDGGWEAGTDYESVLGIRTADCAGYTARLVSWLSNGGPMTLSLWLGDVVADPNAPGGGEAAESDEALSTFYSLLGI